MGEPAASQGYPSAATQGPTAVQEESAENDEEGKRQQRQQEAQLEEAAKQWAASRRSRLHRELRELQHCDSSTRHSRLRALQLELHPDKQPPELREHAKVLFVLVQEEWELEGSRGSKLERQRQEREVQRAREKRAQEEEEERRRQDAARKEEEERRHREAEEAARRQRFAVRRNGMALRYAPHELRGDRELVLAAVQQNGGAMEQASARLRSDRSFLARLQGNGRALQFTDEKMRSKVEDAMFDDAFGSWFRTVVQ